MIEKKGKREKPEDFIGWKSEDGKLEVVGIAGKDKWNKPLFKVICTECSKDKELFSEGYFVSTKGHLKSGRKPCGCSKKPEWKDWQYLVLASRVGEKKNFIVHGFAEEFHGNKTKLNLECLRDGHKWTTSIDKFINKGTGCATCSGVYKPTEQEALRNCTSVCEYIGYTSIGFVNGYKNCYSRFEYICKIHGRQNVSYHNFVNNGTRCIGCWKDRQIDLGNGNGYYPERKDEQDFLYILNFNNKYIKVGRSFDIDERINGLKKLSESGIKNIKKLRIFTATHQEIYDYEQELHSELRERNFQHYVGWSTECFENESLFILNKLLDNCGLEEVSI